MTSELLLLRKSTNQALEKIYLKYRNSFLRNLKKHAIEPHDAIRLYHDAFIALREHCIDDAFIDSKITLKSGLIAISEVLLREQKLVSEDSTWSPKKPFDTITVFQTPKITLPQRTLGKHFKMLGLRCQKMLSLFYYRRLSLPEIIQILGHETELIVRRQKTRCLLSLKETITSPAYEEKEALLDHYIQNTLAAEDQKRFEELSHDEGFKEDLKFITDLQAITGSIDRKDFKTTMVTFENNISSKHYESNWLYYIKKWSIPLIVLLAVCALLWFYLR